MIRLVSLFTVSAWILCVTASCATVVVPIGSFRTVVDAAQGEPMLAWDGKRASDEYACTAAFAALELERHARVAGAVEPTLAGDATVPKGDLILLGGPADNAVTKRLLPELSLEGLGPEGYVIRSASVDGSSVLVIAGGGRVGTLYGVYDYLHRLGFRWFAPGVMHEEWPRLESLMLEGFDIREQPDFSPRGFHAWHDRGNDEFFLWMARNRLNLWGAEEDNHPLLRKLGIQLSWGGHRIGTEFLRPGDDYPYDHPRFDEKSKLPPDPYPVGPGFSGDANQDGRLSYLEAHPEWYGLRDGKRVKGFAGNMNFCTSNRHAVAEFNKNLLAELTVGEARDADWINFWTIDVGRWCECESCRALGEPTDRYLHLVHDFDQAVKQARAEGRLSRPVKTMFLIYYDVLEPPTRPLPEGFDYNTCVGNYFPIKRCFVHVLDDDACPVNRHFMRVLNSWAIDPARHYRGSLCVGEYYNVSRFRCLPICFMHDMAHDIPMYKAKANASSFHYMHVTTDQWGSKALTNYQMARQCWDTDADVEALWRDYFEKRYGPAAGEMREFYASMEKMLSNCNELFYGFRERLNAGRRELFPDPHLCYSAETRTATEPKLGPSIVEMVGAADACRVSLERALKMDLPRQVQGRIEEDRLCFAYGDDTLRMFEAVTRGLLAHARGEREAAHAALDDANRLADRLRADRISVRATYAGSEMDGLAAAYLRPALERLEQRVGGAK